MHSDLIGHYEEKGLYKAFSIAKNALINGYDDSYLVLAKHAQELGNLDDALIFFMETKNNQSPEANDLRFEFANFIYTSSPENQQQALQLLLITHNEFATELRTQIYNELTGLYGTDAALKTLGIDVDTLMQLGEIIKTLSRDNKNMKQENAKLKKQLNAFKTAIDKPGMKPSAFFNGNLDEQNDDNSTDKLSSKKF